MSSELKVNVSWIKTHRICPRKSHYENVLHRVPEGDKPSALDAGTLFHKAMDALYHPSEMGESYTISNIDEEFGRMLSEGEVGIEGYDEWTETLRPMVQAWTPPSDWTFISTEQQFELTLPNGINCQGTIDAAVEWNGKLWHLQYKTTHSSTKPEVYAELQRTDWHECVYHRMLEKSFPDHIVGGTILVLVKKLSAKRLADSPLAGLTIHYLDRSDEVVANALVDMAVETNSIIQEIKGVRHIMHDPQQCGGPYKNKLCPYREVCFGTEDINGSKFKTVESRYAPDSSEAGDA